MTKGSYFGKKGAHGGEPCQTLSTNLRRLSSLFEDASCFPSARMNLEIKQPVRIHGVKLAYVDYIEMTFPPKV